MAWNGYGLSRVDPRDLSVTWFRHDPADPASLPADQLSSVLIDRDSRLWLGTEGEGVLVRESGATPFAGGATIRPTPRV